MTESTHAGQHDLRRNNFDLIRLLAAAQVVIGHGREHLHVESRTLDLAWGMLGRFPGVPVFFVISGFLISMSWERSPTGGDYHMPVINVLLFLGFAGWTGFWVLVPATVVLATGSWLFVEKPALSLKRRSIRQSSPGIPGATEVTGIESV